MGLTKAQAIARLNKISTAKQLRNLIRQLDTTGSGTTTLLWSGMVSGFSSDAKKHIHSQEVADSLQKSDPNIRTIATTEAGKFLDLNLTSSNYNQSLHNKLKTIFRDQQQIDEFLNGGIDPKTGKRLSKGIWDDVSEKFVKETKGSVRLIVGGAGWDRVFAQTELRALLDNPAISEIEGLPIASLRIMEQKQGFNALLKSLIALSDVTTGLIRVQVDSAGRPISGIDGTFKLDARDYMQMSQSNGAIPSGMRTMIDFIPVERRLRHVQAVDDFHRLNPIISSQGYLSPRELDPHYIPGVVHRLATYTGTIGDVVSVGTMVSKASSELGAGDHQAAQHTVASWAFETVGSLVAGRLATIVVAPLMMTGPIGFVLGAGTILIASIAGGELGKKLLRRGKNRLVRRMDEVIWMISPLVLDLDGNGIQTLPLQTNYLYFDLDNNNFAERSGWVGPGDGLLILDLNQNGQVDSGAELFGNHTRLENGELAPDGFVALSMYDLNGDERIDNRDPIWHQLRVWRDQNSNAKTDPGEWFELNELQIKALHLSNYISEIIDDHGNLHLQHGSYERSNGQRADMIDIWFAKEAINSLPLIYREVDEQTAALPNLPGMGIVPSLHQALMDPENPTLRSTVLEWIGSTREERMLLMENLLYQWCKANDNPFAHPYRGYSSLDPLIAQKVAVVEKLFGDRAPDSEMFIGVNRANAMSNLFRDICLDIDMLFNAEIVIKPLFQLAIPVETAHFGPLQMDLTDSLQHIRLQFQRDPDPSFIPMIQWQLLHHENPGQTVFQTLKTLASSTPDHLDRAFRLQDVHTLPWEWMRGTAGADELKGSNSDDFIEGGRSYDVLWGEEGNDTLHGGRGADFYYGGLGGDTYIVSQNNHLEYDRILDEGSVPNGKPDRVLFWDLASNQVQPVQEADRIVFYSLKHGVLDPMPLRRESVVSITKQLQEQHRIEQFHFADGVVWSHQSLLQHLPVQGTDTDDQLTGLNKVSNRFHGLGGHDTLVGGVMNDRLEGQLGDDKVFGLAGADTLIGGPGHDHLEGGPGADTYFFSSGSDTDTIKDFAPHLEKGDQLIFNDLPRSALTSVVRTGRSLRLSFGSSSSVLLVNQLNPLSRIETFVFSDGFISDHESLMRELS
jgi:hypothetical protein